MGTWATSSKNFSTLIFRSVTCVIRFSIKYVLFFKVSRSICFNRQVSLIKSDVGLFCKHCSGMGWLNKIPSRDVARENIT